MRRIHVGPFLIDDLTRDRVVRTAVELALSGDRARFYALHVGGLNHRHDAGFVAEMNAAELVCADGGSVVGLAHLAGSRCVERAPTTDIGWDVLRGVTASLGRPVRVALVGGPPGLAELAGEVLSADGCADIVYTQHGYHEQWDDILVSLNTARPEICVVGMGVPREMLWVRDHLRDLPVSLIMTCGGWFGFLAGQEGRAPTLLRRLGLEWLYRFAQSPRRLGPRYVRGLLSTVVLGFATIRARWGPERART